MVKLARLFPGWDKQPQLFERYWDRTMSTIEGLLTQILSLPEVQDSIRALATLASQAGETADNAAQVAESVNSRQSLIDSYVSGASVYLSATDAGVVTVYPHTRVYADPLLNPSVEVLGGTITSLAAPGATVRVFYEDPSRQGGSVVFDYSVDPSAPAPQTGVTHCVGAVIIPSTGSQDGIGVHPPGFVTI